MEIQIHFRRNSKPFTPSDILSGVGKIARQASGLDRWAHVEILVEPLESGTPFTRYSWEVSDDVIPACYFDSVLEGIKQYLESTESPYDHLSNARIRVVSGSFNETDSSPMAFVGAAYRAIKDALSPST